MRVLIAAAAFSSGMSGIQRHAINLTRSLLMRPEISAVHLVLAPWQRGMISAAGLPADERLAIHCEAMGHGSPGRNLWYYRRLPALARVLEVDLVHLSYPAPVDGRAFTCPVVVTLHDLYPYEIPLNFGFPKCIFNRLALRQCLSNVDAIACVSDTTFARLALDLPEAAGKAVRIHNCVEPPGLCAIKSPIPAWSGNPFLLCVAQHRRNKNIHLLIEAFHRLLQSRAIDASMQLIVVGIRGPETPHIQRQIESREFESQVFLLDGMSDAELQWCYARCEALVAPSSTEGFGLPVAEALLAGSRVVCSDIPAHREIGGNRCRFVPLREGAIEALAAAIVAGVHDPRVEAVALPQFAASELGQQYVALYRGLLAPALVEKESTFASSLQPNSGPQSL